MTEAELFAELKTLGMPVAYGEFKKPTAPPFITYQFAYASDKMADNQNYVEIGNYQIELYTKKKDPATEKLVQDKLKSIRLPYRKLEAWIDSENLWQIVYDVQLIGG